MQNAVEHEPRPCVFFLEDNGYDLMVFSWHRNQQGLFDAMSFKHLQYDDLSMQVTTISHSEDMSEPFPAKTMSDGELLTQSRVYRDEYQHWREHDGGTVARGMTGRRVMRSGLLKPGLEQKPLLNLNDGRTLADWDEFTDQPPYPSSRGQPISPTPAPPAGAARTDTDPTDVTPERRPDGRGDETGLAERVGGEQARAHLYIACEGRTRLAEDDRRTPPRHRHRWQGPDRLGDRHVHEREEPEAEERGTGRQHQVQTRHPGRAVHRPRSGTPHHAGRPADARPGGQTRRNATATPRRRSTRHRWSSSRRPWRNPGRRSNACRAGSRNTSVPVRTSRPSQ